ncbi:MAG: amidohydrolase family protein [Acidobacteriota bacterium]
MFRPKGIVLLILLVSLAVITPLVRAQEARQGVIAGASATLRTIEFETTQVTEADVAVSPDGQWLIFTMLGHLFRLPVTGGTAEQLTFGPYYDSDPVVSPDGLRVAFVSDRDGGTDTDNIFVLSPANGQITQVTHEPWTGRPTWTPDGRAIVYLSFVGERSDLPSLASGAALLRRIRLGGGEPETVSAPARLFRSVFYLPDGRLAWTVVQFQETGSSRATTRIEVLSSEGTVSTLRMLEAYADRVIASPAGDGLYCRCYLPLASRFQEHLLFVSFPEGAERQVLPLGSGLALHLGPRFGLASDGKTLYLGQAGRLWKIGPVSGVREPIPFSARVKLEIQDPVVPRKAIVVPTGPSDPPRSIRDPLLSPDGRTVVFGAAGYLWQQPLGGGHAQRLFEGNAFERDQAFSPDGRRLAFVRTEHGEDQVRVFDFDRRHMRTLASGLSYSGVSWSPDGQRIVFVEREAPSAETESPRLPVVAVNVTDGHKEKLVETVSREAGSRPHFSGDGQWLYFSLTARTLYRVRLTENAKPVPITQLTRMSGRALVSPDGKWLAFRRNAEIWVARFDREPVTDDDVRQLSPEGSNTFAFTPDGAALTYAVGNRVWRHPLAGGERQEISIRLELHRPTPPPLLLRRVHVLDFPPQTDPAQRDKAGGFGPETSIFIERGRIRWIGSEEGRKFPRDTVILDAGGRFAIPGLFDMHVHGTEGNTEALLAYGVTSVRDVAGYFHLLSSQADRGEASSDPMPRYFFSGEAFRGVRASTQQLLVADEGEAQTYVRRWKERGVHFIKVHPPISWRLQQAVAEEARRQGLPVVGHGTTIEEITKGVALGYASLEHFNRPNRVYDDILQMLAAAGTRWTPTLEIALAEDLLLRSEPERLADPKLRAFAPQSCIRQGQTGRNLKAISDEVVRGYSVEWLASIRAGHRRGVKLQVGTDVAGGGNCFFGASLHWELEYFVQAGLEPVEVLRIATQQAAEAVGAQDDLGTLEPGKLADIVLLDKNPLEDIKNTQAIWRVIKGGWVFDPEKLRPPIREK